MKNLATAFEELEVFLSTRTERKQRVNSLRPPFAEFYQPETHVAIFRETLKLKATLVAKVEHSDDGCPIAQFRWLRAIPADACSKHMYHPGFRAVGS